MRRQSTVEADCEERWRFIPSLIPRDLPPLVFFPATAEHGVHQPVAAAHLQRAASLHPVHPVARPLARRSLREHVLLATHRTPPPRF